MMASPFACPSCRVALDVSVSPFACPRCGRTYVQRDGIYRFLPDTDPELARFHDQYRKVRASDGSLRKTADACRQLPDVDANDPRAGEWAVRKRSFAVLCGVLQRTPHRRGPLRIADLGAGNGWLSHRLARAGHEPFTVDRCDDDADGLGACANYDTPFVCVQADFNALPFTDGAFDAVVLNGSLHYSPAPSDTLAEARRVLGAGGTLVVMDSPMFRRDDDGEAMVAGQLRRMADEHGIPAPLRPGVGFLTCEGLDKAASALGMQSRFTPSRGPLAWRLRREIGRLRLRRAPAAFGVWVAQ
jgi:SAM-dependent methyltransferase